jgi:Cu-Zn family superoxide dismutase
MKYQYLLVAVSAVAIGSTTWAQDKGPGERTHPAHAVPAQRILTPELAHETSSAGAQDRAAMPVPAHGVAVFQASKGAEVKGVLQLADTKDGLRVWGEISGLSPGEHGFHIHEFGDLRSDDGMATGAHFSSTGHSHGDLNADKGHEGDFGNVVADDTGVAKIDVVSTGLRLHFVLGRAFVVHAGKDDLTTQPSGNSGARIGVALIGVAKAPEPKK